MHEGLDHGWQRPGWLDGRGMMLARGDTVMSIDNFATGRRDNLLAITTI